MSNTITVGISDMKLAANPDILVTFALGSCVGISMYDPLLKIGGLAHIMLPNESTSLSDSNKFKFADSCLPILLKQLTYKGCSQARLVAKIAGGAKMFNVVGDSALGNIGERNVISVKQTLRQLGIRLLAEDTGLNYGRTVYFSTETGMMEVKSFSKPLRVL